MIKILFFGKLADIAIQELGESETSLKLSKHNSEITLQELTAEIGKKSTTLATEITKPSNRCAINQAFQNADVMIKDSDEVAFMSPLSGG